MFDTMTFTKIIGGFCGALLVFLLGSWVAEILYHGGGGHGEKHAEGYAIEVEDAGAEGADHEVVPLEGLVGRRRHVVLADDG